MMNLGTDIGIPAIDFSDSNLKPGSSEWDDVKFQVKKAAQEFGCFEATFNKIPQRFKKAILDLAKELFDLPLQTKMLNVSDKPLHGYLGQIPFLPLFESIGIEDPTKLAKSLWPQGHPTFSKTMESYIKEVSELDKMIRRMIVESLGVEKYVDDDFMNAATYCLRVMKFDAPENDDPITGIPSHTDKNLITILFHNQVSGLELQTKDGEWIHVNALPGSFVVFIGETFYAWANGHLHSPYHRVTMSGKEERYTIGLFSRPKPDYLIKAPEELVDEDHPLLFKPYTYSEFLKLRGEGGLKATENPVEYNNLTDPLKGYYGVN